MLSDMSSSFKVRSRYSGEKIVNFHLLESPDGMTIDSRSGYISWNPPESTEGSEANVKVSATDGEAFAQVEFTVPVADPTPIETQVDGNTVTVTEADSNLNGLALTLPSQVRKRSSTRDIISSDDVNVEIVSEDEVSAIPDGVQRLTDFFRVTPIQTTDSIKLDFPDLTLPDGRYPFELMLYSFSDDVMGEITSFWRATQNKIDIDENGIVSIRLYGLGHASFIGLPNNARSVTVINEASEIRNRSFRRTYSENGITVNSEAKVWLNLGVLGTLRDNDHQICTVDGDSGIYTITIKNFDDNNWTPETSLEELAIWIYKTKEKFQEVNLECDPEIEVIIEDLNGSGEVRPDENFSILHLTDDNEIKSNMQGTTSHEFFHHAQSRTVDGNTSHTNILSQTYVQVHWLVEGTARWFEDEVWDDLNTYRLKAPPPYDTQEALGKIMTKGFNATYAQTSLTRGYAKFGIWKLISSKCTGFYLPDIFNGDYSSDETGINDLISLLQSDEWNCDFTHAFGSENSNTLGAALLYYQYGTIRKNDISLLDSNEDEDFYNFIGLSYFDKISPSVLQLSKSLGAIPPNGAISFLVNPVAQSSIGDNQEVYLNVNISGGTAWVSISGEELETSNTTNTWFKTSEQTQFTYGRNGADAPELFITLVNPASSTSLQDVNVEYGIRDIVQGELVLTTPISGSTYNNRVINVQGTIPDELVGQVNKVLITQPNVSGAENVATVSGNTFSGKAVIRLGSNSISVVGLNSQGGEVTEPTTVTFTGEESSTPDERNALIKSNMVYVLNWDTNGTDIDMYVTDPQNRTIYYPDDHIKIPNVGRLDYDNQNGYGPEVTTFFTNGNAVAGDYEVNINYYLGSPSTLYTVDVLLNEGSNGDIFGYRYLSSQPLTTSNSGQYFPPSSTNASWGADVIKVNCTGTGINQICNRIQ
ncbi:hypothetical protein GMMP13_830042 [Candidatus Magnetomoraceae bacterium gMMP-13]